jgi:hypothetical protein
MDQSNTEATELYVEFLGRLPKTNLNPIQLLSTLSGGTSIVPSARPVESAGESAVRSIALLSEARLIGGSIERRVASRYMREILSLMSEPYQGYAGATHSRALLDFGGRAEAIASTWFSIVGRRVGSRFLGNWWTVARIVLSAIASMLLSTGHIGAALILVTARVLGSMRQPTPGLSGDIDSSDQPDSGDHDVARYVVSWVPCAVGHFCDGLVMIGVSIYLTSIGRTFWGGLVGLVAVFGVSATLTRVAAVQGGIVLRRLFLERVLRNGFLLLGLTLHLVVGMSAPTSPFPPVAIAGLGMGLYGIIEVWRVLSTYTASLRTDRNATLDEMVWRRMANLVPLVERAATADQSQASLAAEERADEKIAC